MFASALTAVGAAHADDGPAQNEALERFNRSCVLCHVGGQGGAPRMGDSAAWAPRLAQGEDVLLRHTIEGYNNMPPLGYCQDCGEAELRALIRMLSTGVMVH